MNNKDLIKKYVTTSGQRIPEYQFDKLNNNLKTSYLRRRLQAIEHIGRRKFLATYEILSLPEENKKEYIKKLSHENIYDILRSSDNPYPFYQGILKYVNNFRINESDFNDLLIFGNDSDGIAKIMIDVYDGNLSMEQMRKILICVLNPLEIKELIEKKQPLVIFDDIVKFDSLTRHVSNPHEVHKILIDYFKDNLTDLMIYLLLRNSKMPLIIDKLIRKYRDYKIEDEYIKRLIEYGANPNELKELLKIG